MNTDKLLKLIQEALDQAEPVTINDSSETLQKWDSIAQLQVLMLIDQETDGKAANIPELAIALSAQGIVDTLKAHGLLDE
jgi:acyl carrier protein